MSDQNTSITLTVNGFERQLSVGRVDCLLDVLRGAGYKSVKRGCDTGDCGMCVVLMDGQPVRSCMLRAVEVDGAAVTTVEGLVAPDGTLHPIQQAFVETGAIQCGFCTPAQMLLAKALLDINPNPDEEDIRQVMNSAHCRCTGYVRLVEAVQRAAAVMRGEEVPPISHIALTLPGPEDTLELPEPYYRQGQYANSNPLPPLVYTPKEMAQTEYVGAPQIKVDAVKLAKGKPAFADDVLPEGTLVGALLTSPHAHARIKRIDTSKAEALPGVHAILTYKNVPRAKYATGGQSWPQPEPYDQVVFDDKVRHVGDRVAAVAADDARIARRALRLIKVEYEILPPVVDMVEAMQPGAPVIHDEPDTMGIYDAERNIVYHIKAETGDVDQAFAEADHVFEGEYITPKQQHVNLESHVCVTYWDEDDRMVVRTSTQVPFHVRRIIAPLIGLPIKRIRVIKPRIGGGFGNKQEILIEDVCALLTIRTGRPVKIEYTRTQEFNASRSRHPNIIRYKVGVRDDIVTAMDLYLIGDTGAYATHGLTVQMVGGFKGLTLYNPPNARFLSDVVYTNTPPAGAFRGYGSMQCQYGVEVIMEEIAEKLGLDVVEFKRNNWIKIDEPMYLSRELGEGREGYEQTLVTSGMADCLRIGLEATDYYAKRERFKNQTGRIRHGIGFSVMMHGSAIAGLDMAAATLKMNDDGSFNLLIGATDIGTGSDTVLAQIASEVLGIPVEDLIVYSSDTDFTPFDKGAYASSTTYLSGMAVHKTALKIKDMLLDHAAFMLGVDDPNTLTLADRKVTAPDGRSVTLKEIGLSSFHVENQHQIMATDSHVSYVSPPPTAAQFVEVAVDMETGQIHTERLLMVVDCGRVINPITAAGQVEGGVSQALGFALTEEMLFDREGQPLNPRIGPYYIPKASDMPPTDVIFVQTDEPTGPYGAKSVAEISIDGVGPAMVSAVHNATGVWMRQLPLTPERVWRSLNGK